MAAAAWLESVGPITTSALAAARSLACDPASSPAPMINSTGLPLWPAGGVDVLHGKLGRGPL